MRLAPIVLALFAAPAFAVDVVESCRFEPRVLFKADRPKAKATTIKPALTAAKPKLAKLMKPVPRDGFDWICDDEETITAAPLERIAAVPMPDVAAPAEPIPFSDSMIAVGSLPPNSVVPVGWVPGDPIPDDVYAAGPAPIPGPWGVGVGGGGFAPCDCAPPPCPIPAVPEPSTWALLSAGIAAIVAKSRQRRA